MIRAISMLSALLVCVSCGQVPNGVDGEKNVWLEAAPLTLRRQELAAVVLNGRIYLAGGRSSRVGSMKCSFQSNRIAFAERLKHSAERLGRGDAECVVVEF